MKLVVATRNIHKMEEIRSILARVPDLEVMDLRQAGVAPSAAEDELEPYDTFEENAASKAGYFQQRTGLATVADDSGLVVDALGGAPGVRSKRFAPDTGVSGRARDIANNRHLVASLEGIPESGRGARYVCVAALVLPGADPVFVRGRASGRIVDVPRGREGFGYDPHFIDPASGRTFAELTADEKHARSHRGRAFRALVPLLAGRADGNRDG